MPKLQHGKDGKHTVTVPSDIVTGKGWAKGDEIGFGIVDEFNHARPGDIVVRKNR